MGDNNLIEIPLNGATVFLTQQEMTDLVDKHAEQELKEEMRLQGLDRNNLNRLLLKDIRLYKTALQRGKAIKRSRTQKSREAEKWSEENPGQALH